MAIETRAKERAALVLIVIDRRTRSLVSIHEAVECICRGRSVRLVIDDVPSGLALDGVVVSAAELADLNGARQCLRDVAADRRHVRLFPDVAAAVGACVAELSQLAEWRRRRRSMAVDRFRCGGPSRTDPVPRRSYTGGSVYLGGNVAATSWREDVAVPVLRRAGIAVHVPAVDCWQPLEMASGATQLQTIAALILFVVPKHLRSIAAMTEAVALVLRRDAVVLVVEPVEEGDMVEHGVALTGRAVRDLTRALAYLRDMAERNSVAVFSSVPNALDAIIAMATARVCENVLSH